MGHAILERVLLFGTRSADYIRASGHNGCIATEVTLQAVEGASQQSKQCCFLRGARKRSNSFTTTSG